MKIEYQPIGIIRSPFREIDGMPIQPPGALGVRGSVELFPEYWDGLKDLDGFSHIILPYHFHRSSGYELQLVPFLDSEVRGLFAARAPKLPNPIGLSVVKLRNIEGCILHSENVDMVDGTPLLDIKPYVPQFDEPTSARTGWVGETGKRVERTKFDKRFA